MAKHEFHESFIKTVCHMQKVNLIFLDLPGITAAISRGLLDINHSIQMTCVMMIMRMRMTMSKICILSQSHLPSSCSL